MPPTSAPPPVVRNGPLTGPGGWEKMCSGAWTRGPESPVGLISLSILPQNAQKAQFGQLQDRFSWLEKYFISHAWAIYVHWLGYMTVTPNWGLEHILGLDSI